MPETETVRIEGVDYVSASDAAREVGVSRQTLWRWRQDGKIPVGRRFRDGRVLFTEEEFAEIWRFANRLEPIDESERDQLKLFERSTA